MQLEKWCSSTVCEGQKKWTIQMSIGYQVTVINTTEIWQDPLPLFLVILQFTQCYSPCE